MYNIHIHTIYIYIQYIYTEGFFEVAIESWHEWNLSLSIAFAGCHIYFNQNFLKVIT